MARDILIRLPAVLVNNIFNMGMAEKGIFFWLDVFPIMKQFWG